jgi:putative membrane protein
MRLLIRLMILMVAIAVVTLVIPGVRFEGALALILSALVLGLANALLRPLLILFTLPLVLLTAGLFVVVINAGLLYLVAWIVPGFHVEGFGWALLASLIISAVSFILNRLVPGRKK